MPRSHRTGTVRRFESVVGEDAIHRRQGDHPLRSARSPPSSRRNDRTRGLLSCRQVARDGPRIRSTSLRSNGHAQDRSAYKSARAAREQIQQETPRPAARPGRGACPPVCIADSDRASPLGGEELARGGGAQRSRPGARRPRPRQACPIRPGAVVPRFGNPRRVYRNGDLHFQGTSAARRSGGQGLVHRFASPPFR